jgi:hypothetical protein
MAIEITTDSPVLQQFKECLKNYKNRKKKKLPQGLQERVELPQGLQEIFKPIYNSASQEPLGSRNPICYSAKPASFWSSIFTGYKGYIELNEGSGTSKARIVIHEPNIFLKLLGKNTCSIHFKTVVGEAKKPVAGAKMVVAGVEFEARETSDERAAGTYSFAMQIQAAIEAVIKPGVKPAAACLDTSSLVPPVQEEVYIQKNKEAVDKVLAIPTTNAPDKVSEEDQQLLELAYEAASNIQKARKKARNAPTDVSSLQWGDKKNTSLSPKGTNRGPARG